MNAVVCGKPTMLDDSWKTSCFLTPTIFFQSCRADSWHMKTPLREADPTTSTSPHQGTTPSLGNSVEICICA